MLHRGSFGDSILSASTTHTVQHWTDSKQNLFLCHGQDVMQLLDINHGVKILFTMNPLKTFEYEHYRIFIESVNPLMCSPKFMSIEHIINQSVSVNSH